MYKKDTNLLIDMCVERGIINVSDLGVYSKETLLFSNRDAFVTFIDNTKCMKDELISLIDIDQSIITSLQNQILFLEGEVTRHQQMIELLEY